MEFLEVGLDGCAAGGEDLGAVELDGEVGEVGRGIVKLAEVIAGVEEAAEDGEAGLGVGLAPFLRFGVPRFDGTDACAGHGEVCNIEDVSSFTVLCTHTIVSMVMVRDGRGLSGLGYF